MNRVLWTSLIMAWITNILLVLFLFFMLHRFVPPVPDAPLKETPIVVEEPT